MYLFLDWCNSRK